MSLYSVIGKVDPMVLALNSILRRGRVAALTLAAVAASLQVTAEPAPAEAPAAVLPADAASPARMRLLSQEQFANTIAYVFGPDITVSSHFAPFRRTEIGRAHV